MRRVLSLRENDMKPPPYVRRLGWRPRGTEHLTASLRCSDPVVAELGLITPSSGII